MLTSRYQLVGDTSGDSQLSLTVFVLSLPMFTSEPRLIPGRVCTGSMAVDSICYSPACVYRKQGCRLHMLFTGMCVQEAGLSTPYVIHRHVCTGSKAVDSKCYSPACVYRKQGCRLHVLFTGMCVQEARLLTYYSFTCSFWCYHFWNVFLKFIGILLSLERMASAT